MSETKKPVESQEDVKRDWKKIVEGHPGELYFCPDALLEEVQSWLDTRQLLSDELARISKIEVETKVKLENIALKLRNHLEDIGAKNAWTAEVGFQTAALADGEIIISVSDTK